MTDPGPDAVTKLFLNQTFKLYKANHSLTTTEKLGLSQINFLKVNVAKHLFSQYSARSRSNHELIAQYVSFRDIEAELKFISGTKSMLPHQKVQYLIIKCSNPTLLPRQVILFVTDVRVTDAKSFNTIILAANTTMHNWIISLLENLVEVDIPLLIKQYRLSDEYIPTITNQLFNKFVELKDTRGEQEVRILDRLIGDIEMIFSSKHNPNHVINTNLKNINVKIPNTDVIRLIDSRLNSKNHSDATRSMHFHESKLNLIDAIHDHLYKVTKLNFPNLTMIKFRSSLFSITIDGKLRIEKMDIIDGEGDHPVWFLVESVYNELMI